MAASDPTASLEDVIITPALADRVASFIDPEVELAALKDLVQHFATEPETLLQRLVNVAVERCAAGSAGVSLLEPGPAPGQGIFRWVAMAGAYRDYAGRTTPESFSPCGVCLGRGTAQLYSYPARLFTYLAQAAPEIVEGLVVPLRSVFEPFPLGTIWIVSHDAKTFTTRELAVMTDFANFTAAAVAMQRARDRAKAADRAKDEFLAVVSHELRRPLTAIVGWSELLLSGRSTPATAARAIVAVRNNARRQQAMVEDLLDAARTLTGTLRLNETSMDLAAVVQSAIEIVSDSAHERGLELSATIAASLPFRGDPDRLHQVAVNLLDNAVKFTPSGGRVSVSLRPVADAVELLVRDTGRGFAPHTALIIFDAFRLADATSTRRENGLGLGLTIAQHLVTLHGGTLEGHSAGEGCGAQFRVRLPAERMRAGGASTVSPVPSPQLSRKPDGVTVLVVDDDQDAVDMLAFALEEAGATVVTASDVTSAREVLTRQVIDVLVTDISMPERDGYDLIAGLDRDRWPGAPHTVIAVTALAAVLERERILAAGFDHHLPKPVDLQRLVTLVATSKPREAR